MMVLAAADALHNPVLRVAADARPRGLDEMPPAAIFAVFDEAPAGTREPIFLGLVTSQNISRFSNRIFVDLLPRRLPVPARLDAPLEEILARMDAESVEAIPVLNSEKAFAGAITRTSLFSALLKRERALLAESQYLRRVVEDDHRRLSTWLARSDELSTAATKLLGLLAAHALERDLLQNGIDAVTKLLQARYGAVGILDDAGQLTQFFYTGIGPEDAERIGLLPQGRGLLGAVILENQVLRLDDMTSDPRSAGFPPHHPPMKSLLAVPVSHQGHAYGRVYLCDKTTGEPFTAHDEVLASSFARSLAMILANAHHQAEREQAEGRLRESEQRFRELAENIQEVFWISDPQKNHMIYISPGYEDIWGRTCESLYTSPRSWLDAIHPDDRDRVLEAATTKQTLSEYNEEYRIIRPDGSLRWIKDRAFPVRNEKGEVYRVVGIAENITERKRAEESLQLKTDQLEAVTGAITTYLETGNWREASARILQCALTQTASTYGFVGVVVEGPALRILAHDGIVWDATINRELYENAARTYQKLGYLEFTNFENLFGRVITGGQTVISNDPSADPRAGGYPPGHPPLRAFMGVPIRRGTDVVGMIGVANRAGGYGGTEHTHIEILCQAAGVLYDNYRRQQREIALEADRRQAEHAFQESERRLSAILTNAADGIITIDGRGAVESFNPAAERIFGYAAADVVGQNVKMLMPDPYRSEHDSYLRAYGETGQGRIVDVGPREVLGRRQDGTVFPMDLAVSEMQVESRRVFIGIVRDISERKHDQERLNLLAHYDTLTSLPNRVLFNDRLKQTTIAAARHDRVVTVMFIDLDRFKTINDTLGHDVGDLVIKAAAERIVGCLRAGDTVARLGGDEYAVILADMAKTQDAARVAQKVVDAFSEPFRVAEHELFVTVSIGATLYPSDDTSVDNLLKNADTSMYRAKERGRNTYQFYTADMNAKAGERLALETHLRHALERGELLLHYQPQVDLQTGRIIGVEALVRWQRQTGLVSPADFIPLAEETGLIVPIGEWVLRTACARGKAWHDAGFGFLQVSVNVSARQFRQNDFSETVAKALRDTGFPPVSLELEMTESLLMEHAEAMITRFEELHAMGVSLSIDDFGIGYSSLSYLKRFPIDTVKIDRSFVKDVTTDPDHAAIASGIISLAQNLRLKVVAEGVETEEQAAFLCSRRCDAMQGYLFSRPVSHHALTSLLSEGRRWAPIKPPPEACP